jgi:hypothetical protein
MNVPSLSFRIAQVPSVIQMKVQETKHKIVKLQVLIKCLTLESKKCYSK